MTESANTAAQTADANARYEYVSPHSIIIPALLLRGAQVEDEKYQVLKASLAQHGQRSPLLVSPGTEPGTYVLSDGMQRLSILKSQGVEKVFVRIESMDEAQIVESQMEMNLARVDVKPSEYSKLLVRYAQKFPAKTKSEVAEKLGVSVDFLNQRLNFAKLAPEIQTLADEGTIGMGKAVILSGLDTENQKEFIERAATLDIAAFAKAVSARKTELAKAKQEGRPPKVEEFIPTANLRAKVELIAENETLAYGMSACSGLETALDGYVAAIKWVLRLDAASLDEARQKWEQAKKETEERKARQAEERERKKKEAAAAEQTATAVAGEAVGAAVRG